MEKGNSKGEGRPVVNCTDVLSCAVQKRLNQSTYRFVGGRLGSIEVSPSSVLLARWRQRALMGVHVGASGAAALCRDYFNHSLLA